MRMSRGAFVPVVAIGLVQLAGSGTGLVGHMVEHTVATGLTSGYQVVIADMNKDGKPDLIAVAEGLTDLVWFENPSWQRHVIAGGFSRMINVAAYDIDGDGIPELALGHEFNNVPPKSVGIVSILTHQPDLNAAWSVKEIDRLPASHRLRWADIDGSGKKVLVNFPLAAATAEPPDYRGHVPLVYYRPGDWKRQMISETEEGAAHGVAVVNWDGGKRESLLAGSFLGISLYRFANGNWTRAALTKGDPSPWPKSGASDVALGHQSGERFLAAIEPFHGNQVVVYTEQQDGWQRRVLDDSLVEGHTIVTADLDGDGRDEVIAGQRGAPRRVSIYSRPAGADWTREILDDGGIAACGCAVADLNADGRPDIVCIGMSTGNLKWYENQVPRAALPPVKRGSRPAVTR